MSDPAICAIRTKAELARRLASEIKDPSAKESLLELAALLDADADRIENATPRQGAASDPQ